MTDAMTLEQAMARIAELEAKTKKPTVNMKVSAKGAVSVYGLGRFPVTLYASQWEALLGRGDEIKEFISTNLANLSVKEKAEAQDAQPVA